jgi:hypothetical protein
LNLLALAGVDKITPAVIIQGPTRLKNFMGTGALLVYAGKMADWITRDHKMGTSVVDHV